MASAGPRSPLAYPHILLQTLSYATPRTLGRCMAVSTFWYDIATTFLWAHVSYRVNRFLTDPGVTPFLPIPKSRRLTGLRRAKRRAVRHVKVVEVRRHDCGEVGCGRMTLHGDESESEDGGDDEKGGEEGRLRSAMGGENGTAAASGPSTLTGAPVASISGGGRLSADVQINEPPEVVWDEAVRSQLEEDMRMADQVTKTDAEDTAANYAVMDVDREKPNPRVRLQALRLHIDESHRPRPISFPCPFVSKLDAATLVVVPMRQLSTDRRLPLPSPLSARKLVILLIPPIQVPGIHRLADEIPSTIDEVVIYLWRRHASSRYDSFGETWCAQMEKRRWGPNKLWGHWCNFIMALNARPHASGTRARRYTLVGTGHFDPIWLNSAGNTWDFSEELKKGANCDAVQARFEHRMKACLTTKMKELEVRSGIAAAEEGREGKGREEWEKQTKDCLDNVRFLSKDAYLAEGGWGGEFTWDEMLYHG